MTALTLNCADFRVPPAALGSLTALQRLTLHFECVARYLQQSWCTLALSMSLVDVIAFASCMQVRWEGIGACESCALYQWRCVCAFGRRPSVLETGPFGGIREFDPSPLAAFHPLQRLHVIVGAQRSSGGGGGQQHAIGLVTCRLESSWRVVADALRRSSENFQGRCSGCESLRRLSEERVEAERNANVL